MVQLTERRECLLAGQSGEIVGGRLGSDSDRLNLVALFLDLKHKMYFWQLYTTIRLQSPMSWGAWVLMLITPLSFVWVASYLKEIVPGWTWKYGETTATSALWPYWPGGLTPRYEVPSTGG